MLFNRFDDRQKFISLDRLTTWIQYDPLKDLKSIMSVSLRRVKTLEFLGNNVIFNYDFQPPQYLFCGFSPLLSDVIRASAKSDNLYGITIFCCMCTVLLYNIWHIVSCVIFTCIYFDIAQGIYLVINIYQRFLPIKYCSRYLQRTVQLLSLIAELKEETLLNFL